MSSDNTPLRTPAAHSVTHLGRALPAMKESTHSAIFPDTADVNRALQICVDALSCAVLLDSNTLEPRHLVASIALHDPTLATRVKAQVDIWTTVKEPRHIEAQQGKCMSRP